ncbi:MAG: DUF2917 domain-containing protein [Desulfotignum sp.]
MMETFTDHTLRDRATMNFIFSNLGRPDATIDLTDGQCWRISGNCCQQAIVCHEGQVWITQAHDVKDYILEKGDAFMITMPGQVLVQALSFSRIGYVENLKPEALRKGGCQIYFK